jgi:hypothetical protein
MMLADVPINSESRTPRPETASTESDDERRKMTLLLFLTTVDPDTVVHLHSYAIWSDHHIEVQINV